jgi:hypothetical protein
MIMGSIGGFDSSSDLHFFNLLSWMHICFFFFKGKKALPTKQANSPARKIGTPYQVC